MDLFVTGKELLGEEGLTHGSQLYHWENVSGIEFASSKDVIEIQPGDSDGDAITASFWDRAVTLFSWKMLKYCSEKLKTKTVLLMSRCAFNVQVCSGMCTGLEAH